MSWCTIKCGCGSDDVREEKSNEAHVVGFLACYSCGLEVAIVTHRQPWAEYASRYMVTRDGKFEPELGFGDTEPKAVQVWPLVFTGDPNEKARCRP